MVMHTGKMSPTVLRYLCLVVGLSCAIVLAAHAQTHRESMGEWQSPSGQLAAEAFHEKDGSRSLVVRRNGSRDEATILTFERSIDVIFSPNDQWIAVNDAFGSTDTIARVFRRSENFKFVESKKGLVDDAAWRLVRTLYRAPVPSGLTHRYSEIVAFSADSTKVLVKLHGHEDGDTYVDDWFCVVNLLSEQASLDLSAFDRPAVHFRRE